MSYRSAAWAWDQRQLPPMLRLTLLALANRCDGDDQCWPSIKTIATDAGISASSVDRSLKELITLRLIEIRHQYREDGSLRSSLYHLLIQMPPDTTQTPPSPPPEVTPGTTPTPPDIPRTSQEPSHLISHLEPVKEPECEAAAAALPPTPSAEDEEALKVHETVVTVGYVKEMVIEFGAILGAEVVKDTIRYALGHAAAKKAKDKRLYVRRWLQRDVASLTKHGSGNGGGSRVSDYRGAERPKSQDTSGFGGAEPGSTQERANRARAERDAERYGGVPGQAREFPRRSATGVVY